MGGGWRVSQSGFQLPVPVHGPRFGRLSFHCLRSSILRFGTGGRAARASAPPAPRPTAAPHDLPVGMDAGGSTQQLRYLRRESMVRRVDPKARSHEETLDALKRDITLSEGMLCLARCEFAHWRSLTRCSDRAGRSGRDPAGWKELPRCVPSGALVWDVTPVWQCGRRADGGSVRSLHIWVRG